MAVDWTDTLKQQLRELWAEGLPTSEISRRMGISKNAIVGKAHRIGCEGRPSPIAGDSKRVAAARAEAKRKFTEERDAIIIAKANAGVGLEAICAFVNLRTGPRVTLVQLKKHIAELRFSGRIKAKQVGKKPKPGAKKAALPPLISQPVILRPVAPPKPVFVAPPKTEVVTPMPPSKHPCLWPIGTPRKPGFRFCGELSLMGKPYCEEHCKLAYIRIKQKEVA